MHQIISSSKLITSWSNSKVFKNIIPNFMKDSSYIHCYWLEEKELLILCPKKLKNFKEREIQRED